MDSPTIGESEKCHQSQHCVEGGQKDKRGLVCPRWNSVFVRNLPFMLDSGMQRQWYWPCVNTALPPWHPCKNSTPLACRTSLAFAVI